MLHACIEMSSKMTALRRPSSNDIMREQARRNHTRKPPSNTKKEDSALPTITTTNKEKTPTMNNDETSNDKETIEKINSATIRNTTNQKNKKRSHLCMESSLTTESSLCLSDTPSNSKNEWKCGRCTVFNAKNKRRCYLCQTRKPVTFKQEPRSLLNQDSTTNDERTTTRQPSQDNTDQTTTTDAILLESVIIPQDPPTNNPTLLHPLTVPPPAKRAKNRCKKSVSEGKHHKDDVPEARTEPQHKSNLLSKTQIDNAVEQSSILDAIAPTPETENPPPQSQCVPKPLPLHLSKHSHASSHKEHGNLQTRRSSPHFQPCHTDATNHEITPTSHLPWNDESMPLETYMKNQHDVLLQQQQHILQIQQHHNILLQQTNHILNWIQTWKNQNHKVQPSSEKQMETSDLDPKKANTEYNSNDLIPIDRQQNDSNATNHPMDAITNQHKSIPSEQHHSHIPTDSLLLGANREKKDFKETTTPTSHCSTDTTTAATSVSSRISASSPFWNSDDDEHTNDTKDVRHKSPLVQTNEESAHTQEKEKKEARATAFAKEKLRSQTLKSKSRETIHHSEVDRLPSQRDIASTITADIKGDNKDQTASQDLEQHAATGSTTASYSIHRSTGDVLDRSAADKHTLSDQCDFSAVADNNGDENCAWNHTQNSTQTIDPDLFPKHFRKKPEQNRQQSFNDGNKNQAEETGKYTTAPDTLSTEKNQMMLIKPETAKDQPKTKKNKALKLPVAIGRIRKNRAALTNSTNSQKNLDSATTSITAAGPKPAWINNKHARRFIREMKPLSASKTIAVERSTNALRAAELPLRACNNNLWDDDQSQEPNFPYQETVRCKHMRERLPCHDCPNCRQFFDALRKTGHEVHDFAAGGVPLVSGGNNNQVIFSRHRARFARNETPDDFWELDFIDERKLPHEERRLSFP